MEEKEELSNEKITEIKNTAIEFTRNTLGVECCHYMCYAISYPLHIHLSNSGISNSFKAGSVKEHNNRGHYWIKLDYSHELIIDATARQFNPILDYVHFGEKLAEEGANDFNEAFNKWLLPLINYNRITEESMPPEYQRLVAPVELYIKIGVKAALILIKDYELEKIKDGELKKTNKVYIKSICQAAGNFYRQHPEKLSGLNEAKKVFQYCFENIF